MNTLELDTMIKELHTVADELAGYLPAETIQYFRDFIEHSEVGVGVEILLEQVSENDIVLSERAYCLLEKAGRGIIDDDYFSNVKHK